MRKFTLSVLVLLVSAFFMGQTALGQAKYSKTLDFVKTAIPVVDITKSTNDFDFADMYSIDFEDEVDWTFDFTPWTALDVDLLPTYTMTGVSWPHGGEPQAYIVFNTATTDPPTLDDPELQPHTGDKFGACLASVPDGALGNDDWFISDLVSIGTDDKGASFTFWAKSYTDAYGLERFNVAVSTTTPDPGEFTVISGGTYIEAPMAWTEYINDLSAYAGMDIYVAIQCVSYDAFIFMIDDLVIDPGAAGGDCENFDALTVGLGVAEQLGGYWTTWSGGPADDAMVTDVQSNSPDNSFVVDAGAVDLIFQFGDDPIASGMWLYSHYMYVPTGFSGYFNVQTEPTPGVGWNLELYFDDGGTGYFGGQSAETYAYTQDTWFMVEIMYDLDQGIGRVYFDGALIVEFVNAMTIGAIDYFGADSGGDPGAFYDDVCFAEMIPPGPCENFDALTVGLGVAEQLGGYWTTWSGGSADDAMVTDAQSHSPDNSFVVDAGAVDLIFQFGDDPLSSGMWMYSHYMYVPTGFSGYFNVQTEPTPGIGWNLELYFDDGGTGYFGGQSAETYAYTQDIWFMVEIMYDLDQGIGRVYFDGALIVEFVNAMTIGAIDYYGADSGGDPGAYYDDVCFGEYIPPGPCEDFDALTVGLGVAEQLGGYWTTWSGGSADDAMVTDVQSNSPDNSFVVDAGAIDLIFQFGDDPIASGMWMYSHYMYVPTGFSGYFNVQTEPTPGVGWNLDLYFDDDGTGHFDGQSTETFTYTPDTWFMVEIMYDLDAGIGRVYFDGALILEFVNGLTIGGIDYYGANTGGDPGAYYDDVCFGEYILPSECENFDALTVGLGVAEQLGGYWTTWSGGPADDAMVSDAQSHSPDNSFVVDAGAIDLIFQFGDDPLTSGQWLYSHYMYVPTGFSGYFNVQTEPTPGIDWNLELFFDDGGTGAFAGQSTETFVYDQDTWFLVEIDYDLDRGFGQVLIAGELIIEFVNEMTIGSIDYYGHNAGGPPGAYYDDVCFGPGWIITNVEEFFTSSNIVVYPNPASDKITIVSESIIDEVRIYNNMGQLVYSGQFDNSQIMVNTSSFITGMYIVQVVAGEAIEVRKLIIE